MDNINPELLEEAVGESLNKGASYAEARYHVNKSLEVIVYNGMVVGVGESIIEGVGVRVIADGCLGFSATTKLDREGILHSVELAVASARGASKAVKNPLRMGPGRIGRAKYSVNPKKPAEDIPLDVKVEELVGYYKSLDREVGDFKLQTTSMIYRELIEEKLIVNSDGGYVESKVPRISIFYNLSGRCRDRRANRWGTIGGSGGYELLEELEVQEALREDVRSLRVSLEEAKAPPKGRMDVVLGPEIVALAVHESAGHPSEADRILGREAAQAGLSFRRDYKEERIGSEAATVIDDPTIPKSYGYYLFDEECVAARPRVIYDKGLFGELLHNRETAAIYNVESNGASRARDYSSEPIVRMGNTYLKPGDYSFEELLEDVREGVYIKNYMEWNIDDIRWGQRYVGLEAYVIRGGELREPVTNVALEITTREFYSSIDAVGRDLKFYAGMCGKGEPGQGIPVWFGGPHIRLRGVIIR